MAVRTYTPAEVRAMSTGDAQRLRRELVVELHKAKLAGKPNRGGARLLLELDAKLGGYSDRERAELAAKFLWGERGAQQRGFSNGGS